MTVIIFEFERFFGANYYYLLLLLLLSKSVLNKASLNWLRLLF